MRTSVICLLRIRVVPCLIPVAVDMRPAAYASKRYNELTSERVSVSSGVNLRNRSVSTKYGLHSGLSELVWPVLTFVYTDCVWCVEKKHEKRHRFRSGVCSSKDRRMNALKNPVETVQQRDTP